MLHEPPAPPKRVDAERDREKLLAVARAALEGSEPDISMPEISRRAGVGMATLHRDFPERLGLLALVRSIRDTTAPEKVLSGATFSMVVFGITMSASLPAVRGPVLPSGRRYLAPLLVACRTTSRKVSSGGVPRPAWASGTKE
ncbi:hypothetical protein B0I33_11041 [Prauserella shujinwangii]|uniref:TetR family transcriptional regulator n=1 Tax=Prauserella shujinwangii TaxID=1453103 RepID=A0A2T0LNX9_9PSEU|nr:hypothetical protein B0I33_11041 [Prauserella shujinwangii]